MFNISNLLEKFKKQIQAGELSKKEICDVIIRRTGIPCKPKEVEVKNYTLYINLSPTFKNMIILKKKKILTDLAKISSTKILDVR